MAAYLNREKLLASIKDLPMYLEDINGVFENGTYNHPRNIFENGVDRENVFYVGDVINLIENAPTAERGVSGMLYSEMPVNNIKVSKNFNEIMETKNIVAGLYYIMARVHTIQGKEILDMIFRELEERGVFK